MKNYQEYKFSPRSSVLVNIFSILTGAVIAYFLFGGIEQNLDGTPSSITIVFDIFFVIVGSVVGFKIIRQVILNYLIKKQLNALRKQFRDFLDTLSTSLNAGSNMVKAFESSYQELKEQYNEKADIVQEVDLIVRGFANNIRIEELLKNFGERSGIDDVISFASVFEIANKKGGDMQEVVSSTRRILSDKMDVEEEIETKISSSKNESYVMLILPLIIVAIMKNSGTGFGDSLRSISGAIAIGVALIFFYIAFKVSRKITEIKL